MLDPDLDLDALDALCAAATPGPWPVVTKGNTVRSHAIPGVCSGISPKTGNAAFIAAARTALPTLVARVRALEEANAELQEYYRMWQDHINDD